MRPEYFISERFGWSNEKEAAVERACETLLDEIFGGVAGSQLERNRSDLLKAIVGHLLTLDGPDPVRHGVTTISAGIECREPVRRGSEETPRTLREHRKPRSKPPGSFYHPP